MSLFGQRPYLGVDHKLREGLILPVAHSRTQDPSWYPQGAGVSKNLSVNEASGIYESLLRHYERFI